MYLLYKLPMVTWKNCLWHKNGVTVTGKDCIRHHLQTEVWKTQLKQKGQRKEEKSFQTRCLLWNLMLIFKLPHLHSGNCGGFERAWLKWKCCHKLHDADKSCEEWSSLIFCVWALRRSLGTLHHFWSVQVPRQQRVLCSHHPGSSCSLSAASSASQAAHQGTNQATALIQPKGFHRNKKKPAFSMTQMCKTMA